MWDVGVCGAVTDVGAGKLVGKNELSWEENN
jgi:hypothetical protein